MFYLLKDKNLPCHIISCLHPPSTDPISSIDRKHLMTQSVHSVTVNDKNGYDSCYVIILSDAKPSFNAFKKVRAITLLRETTTIASQCL